MGRVMSGRLGSSVRGLLLCVLVDVSWAARACVVSAGNSYCSSSCGGNVAVLTNTTECWNEQLQNWTIDRTLDLSTALYHTTPIQRASGVSCVYGGQDSANYFATYGQCSNGTGGWTKVPSFATPHMLPSIIYGGNDRIFAVGGLNFMLSSTMTLETLSPNNDTWGSKSFGTVMAQPSRAQYATLTVPFNGTLCLIGEVVAGPITSQCLNLTSMKWQTGPQYTYQHLSAASLTVFGQSCAVGGGYDWNSQVCPNVVECMPGPGDYPLMKEMLPAANYPWLLLGYSNFTIQGMQCIGGGSDGGFIVYDFVYCFNESVLADPRRNHNVSAAWFPIPSFNIARAFYSAIEFEDLDTPSPTTSAPSRSPTTSSPTTLSPTLSPTFTPTTRSPTLSPSTTSPTTSPTLTPTTSSPTLSPTSLAPTTSPTTMMPTASPTTLNPTTSPTTSMPTIAPSTISPTTLSPSTSSPTKAPTNLPLVPAPGFNSDVTSVQATVQIDPSLAKQSTNNITAAFLEALARENNITLGGVTSIVRVSETTIIIIFLVNNADVPKIPPVVTVPNFSSQIKPLPSLVSQLLTVPKPVLGGVAGGFILLVIFLLGISFWLNKGTKVLDVVAVVLSCVGFGVQAWYLALLYRVKDDINLELIAYCFLAFVVAPLFCNLVATVVLICWARKDGAHSGTVVWLKAHPIMAILGMLLSAVNPANAKLLTTGLFRLKSFSCPTNPALDSAVDALGLLGMILGDLPRFILSFVVILKFKEGVVSSILPFSFSLITLIYTSLQKGRSVERFSQARKSVHRGPNFELELPPASITTKY